MIVDKDLVKLEMWMACVILLDVLSSVQFVAFASVRCAASFAIDYIYVIAGATNHNTYYASFFRTRSGLRVCCLGTGALEQLNCRSDLSVLPRFRCFIFQLASMSGFCKVLSFLNEMFQSLGMSNLTLVYLSKSLSFSLSLQVYFSHIS